MNQSAPRHTRLVRITHWLTAVAVYWYFVSLAGLAVTATILSPSW